MTHSRDLVIPNKKGLHARASAKLAALAQSFNARVTVSRDTLSVAATSIMGLMLLAAAKGAMIRISADGPDAEQALDAIEALIADRFGEEA